MESKRVQSKLERWITWAIRLIFLTFLCTVIGSHYSTFSHRAIPVEELRDLFAQSRAHLSSISPARMELGKDYAEALELIQEEKYDLFLDSERKSWVWAEYGSKKYREGAREWVRSSPESIAKLHEISSKGPGAMEIDADKGPLCELPYLGPARAASRLLKIELVEAAREGDGAGVLRAAKTIENIAQTCEHGNFVISRLVSGALRSILDEGLIEERSVLSEPTLRELSDWFELVETTLPEPSESILAEMALNEYYYDRGAEYFASDKPGFLTRLFSQQFIRVAASYAVREHRDAIAAAALPPPEAIRALRQIDTRIERGEVDGPEGTARDYFDSMGYSFAKTYEMIIRDLARVRGTRLVVALERFHRLYGKYPKDLQSLVPDVLKELPSDPFSASTFVYRPIGDQYILYSLNGNLQDDGGKAERNHEKPDDILVSGDDYIIVRPLPSDENGE